MNSELINYLESFLTPRRQELFKQVIAQRTRFLTVAIEDVGHLHNTSAVMRSCDAFGVQDVHVIEELKGKRIDREIAMGAQKWTTVHRYDSTKNALKQLKGNGYQIVATTPHHTAHKLADFKFDQPTALFFGSEKDGLTDIVIEAADAYIYIPTFGFTQSLNISVCAAILLQELTQRLRNSNLDWHLNEADIAEVKQLWLKRNLKDYESLKEKFDISKL
ncbi:MULTISPECIES: RNA methyltransferase [unclassified Leeuwenhoekiella]|uniref:TrmH family RNA methyltransferase n=1 Tax=unclassified Leeuwenhoekiella TaxID=2615029 RepID=UPI000C616EAD|nr:MULTISPECIES: RNA methyltransferase [unclassified Leeuwenhoekiella]MAW94731.1 rRNA methyltransferase [Leeuwenhoekiella sp.]MAW95506.1 rRNA methyltransferase [Leeuwenhoekiella sp.]MBA82154.1 rRNA methyltransferase [Leeuwenhoekiella sp.]|tara:strand:+ start:2822 stop:3478 length:657 start_codon:yes stop_codon:yes gene_type:complete